MKNHCRNFFIFDIRYLDNKATNKNPLKIF